MRLKVLGCGDAFASGGRFNTSFLLFDEGKNVMIDCGASTLIRLKQESINPTDIDTIIITHFHGDHFGGIPFLILSNKIEYDRKKPLIIWGPKGVKEKVVALQEAMYPGTSDLIDEMQVTFKEYIEDVWVEVGGISVFAKQVIHSPASNPHGVKVKLGNKIFAFSGDTEWTDHLIELAENSDLFICECNNFNEDSPGHLSYQKLIKKSFLFNAKRLMINHLGMNVLREDGLKIEKLDDGMEVEF